MFQQLIYNGPAEGYNTKKIGNLIFVAKMRSLSQGLQGPQWLQGASVQCNGSTITPSMKVNCQRKSQGSSLKKWDQCFFLLKEKTIGHVHATLYLTKSMDYWKVNTWFNGIHVWLNMTWCNNFEQRCIFSTQLESLCPCSTMTKPKKKKRYAKKASEKKKRKEARQIEFVLQMRSRS